MIRNKQKGFTIIELILASAFFSFILLFVLVAFVQINRAYTRGVTVKRVQNSARAVMEDITRNLRQTSQGNVDETRDDVSFSPIYRLCLGNGIRYAWNEFDVNTSSISTESTSESDSFSFLRVEDSLNCGDPISSANASQLFSENIVIQNIDVTRQAGGASYFIRIVMSTSDLNDDGTNGGDSATCNVGVGDQFCDVAVLETVVSVRN